MHYFFSSLILLFCLYPSTGIAGESKGIEIYAASSVGEVAKFANPKGSNYVGASSRLATQILSGAHPDIFISADKFWALEVAKANPRYAISKIASNRLVVATLKNMFPHEICDLKIGASLKEVPSGHYADIGATVLGCASPSSRAPNAGILREWLKAKVVDAAYLYETDVIADEALKSVHIFDETQVEISFYALPLSIAGNTWLGSQGLSNALENAGFGKKGLLKKAPIAPGSTKDVRYKNEEIDVLGIVLSSLLIGLIVVCMAFFPAIFFGFFLARVRTRWTILVSLIVLSPLVVPPVVTGLALLKIFGPDHFLSPLIHVFGSPAFTWFGAVLASFIVSLPLFIVMSRRAFEAVDPHFENLGRSCGKSKFFVFRKITLPLAFPGIVAGGMLCFARSVGEFGATAVFAGNLAAEGGTISLAIYRSLQTPGGEEAVWILSLFSLLLSAFSIAGYEYFAQQQRAFFGDNP